MSRKTENQWESMKTNGNPRKTMENQWKSMKIHEINKNPWESIEIHGNQRKSMRIDENGWKSMSNDENQWEWIENDGNQWKSTRIDEEQWKSMTINENLWQITKMCRHTLLNVRKLAGISFFNENPLEKRTFSSAGQKKLLPPPNPRRQWYIAWGGMSVCNCSYCIRRCHHRVDS